MMNFIGVQARIDLYSLQQPNGCIYWTGAKRGGKGGKYATLKVNKKSYTVTRLIAMMNLGLLEKDPRFVMHSCDTPQCVNLNHLSLGTCKDNNLDKINKGRDYNKERTHCHRGHEFTPENTKWYHENRICKTCKVINNNKFNKRRK